MTTGDSAAPYRLAADIDWVVKARRHLRGGSQGDASTAAQGDLEVHPSGWRERGRADYMCSASQLLVDDADLSRVFGVLRDSRIRSDLADSLFGGVSLVEVQGPASEALASIDYKLGVGVATPNHLFGIAPEGHLCPATEPDEPGRLGPWPIAGDGDDGRGVRVAVVDTGFLQGWESRAQTPWLAGITDYDIENPDVVEPLGYVDPFAGHGTFVAGIVRSIAPATEVTVDGILQTVGVVDEASIVKQLGDALEKSPDVINLSSGGYTRNNLPPKAFVGFWAQRFQHHKGVVLVAAAGNNKTRRPFWPAAFPWAVSVGALTADGRQRADFSNHGGWVDVYAPGVDIVNAYCEGEYRLLLDPSVVRRFDGMCKWSGTSFSTPIVAGLIAARMSRTGENARQAADALLEAARGQFLPGVGPRLLP
jgi:subtilisin family serine protease